MSFSKRPRRGISLIETAAVMAVMATLVTMAVGLLYTLMEVEGASRRRIAEEVALSRLADQFRRDAHEAVRCDIPETTDDEPSWRFLFPDGRRTEYRVEATAGRIQWTEISDDQAVRRKTFQLASGVQVSVEQAPLAKLRLTPTEHNARPLTIEAAIGLDHRFNQLE